MCTSTFMWAAGGVCDYNIGNYQRNNVHWIGGKLLPLYAPPIFTCPSVSFSAHIQTNTCVSSFLEGRLTLQIEIRLYVLCWLFSMYHLTNSVSAHIDSFCFIAIYSFVRIDLYLKCIASENRKKKKHCQLKVTIILKSGIWTVEKRKMQDRSTYKYGC